MYNQEFENEPLIEPSKQNASWVILVHLAVPRNIETKAKTQTMLETVFLLLRLSQTRTCPEDPEFVEWGRMIPANSSFICSEIAQGFLYSSVKHRIPFRHTEPPIAFSLKVNQPCAFVPCEVSDSETLRMAGLDLQSMLYLFSLMQSQCDT